MMGRLGQLVGLFGDLGLQGLGITGSGQRVDVFSSIGDSGASG